MEFNLKRVVLAFAISLLLAMGCGGGGGGGNSGGIYTSVRAVAVLASDGQTQLNALQFQPGDALKLKILGTSTSTGSTVEIPAISYAIDSPVNVATIDTAGNISVVGTSSTTYTITAAYAGGSVKLNFKVITATTRITGLVRDAFGNGISGSGVVFYKGSTVVGSGTAGSNGRFLVSVSQAPNGFAVNTAPLNGAYYSEFAYGSYVYSLDVNCPAPVSGITNLATNALPNDAVLTPKTSSTPPSPPTGCLG